MNARTAALVMAVCLVIHSGTLAAPATADQARDPNRAPCVDIVVSGEAGALERFAAAELQRYFGQLFGATSRTVAEPTGTADAQVYLGTPARVSVHQAGHRPLPPLSDQGFLLRSFRVEETPALAIVGGSPAATMWGVYELVERYGVRYLLSGDVIPQAQQDFYIPQIDRTFEPTFRARWFKTMGDFAMGMEGWGMADYRPLLDQLAKLKFNRIRIGGCASAPFLDLRIKGLRRQSAVLFYGERYPITPDMPGRRLFGDATEFWNPDLPPPEAPCQELIAAGVRHVHELIAYAHSRGIEASSVWSLTDFSKDFQSVVPEAQTVRQLGELTVAPGPGVRPDDPALVEIGSTVIRSILNEYPDADAYGFPVGTEYPSWIELHAWAWQELDKQYGIESILPLEEVLRRAGQRSDHWEGGAARSVMEVKGHITGLYYLLSLWNSPEVLTKSRKPDARLVVYEVAEELWPVLSRLLPRNAEQSIVMDYNPTRVLRRRHVLASVPSREIPTTLVLTLHDDSVGMLPLLTTGALHQLVTDMRTYGLTGFGTRQWLISDHDPTVAYLSRAAWDDQATPEAVVADQIRHVCGPAAVAPMLAVFHEVETVTTALEDHGMGLTFPHAIMMQRQWAPEPMPPELREDQAAYQRALDALQRVPEPARADGKAYVAYWRGRLEFAVGYLDTIRRVRDAAMAEQAARDARERGDMPAYRTCLAEAQQQAQAAHHRVFRAIEAYAAVARNRADLGAIATMAQYVCRLLQHKADTLRATLSGQQ